MEKWDVRIDGGFCLFFDCKRGVIFMVGIGSCFDIGNDKGI